jgi:hypothetical protein
VYSGRGGPALTALRGRPDSEVTEMTKPADALALMHAIKQKQTDR